MNVQANTVLMNTPFRGIENSLNLPPQAEDQRKA